MMILSGLLMENREGTLTDKQQEFAMIINSAGKDLLNLINDILDLSKVEAGRLELLYEDVAVAPFCETLAAMFRQQAEQKGLAFSVQVAEDMPETIRIDEQRTQQILKNLLSNAFKFTEKGTVALDISAPGDTTGPLSTPAIAFRVSDSGIGIEQDKHELVFQAFQQVDGSTSRNFGGTGAGVVHLAATCPPDGGRYYAGKRARRRQQLYPLSAVCRDKQDEQSPVSAALKPHLTERPVVHVQPVGDETAGLQMLLRPLPDDRDRLAKGDKSILIIEDDLNFARALMSMVRERGFGCIAAADGTSGLHLAESYCPSAIILDVMLPGMDGWGVMRGLKDNPATRHIPVHFITCLDERQKGMSMGAVGFFTKPVTPGQLEEVFGSIEKNVTRTMKRLLIIEDDRREVESLTSLLQERNLEISVAGSGREAIELLDRSRSIASSSTWAAGHVRL